MIRTTVILAASSLVMASMASAEIVSIPAAAFSPNNPNSLNEFGAVDEGVMKPSTMTILMAPVDFPKNGQKICKMTLVHADENGGEDMTIQLLRKTTAVGVESSASPPAVIGQVTSSGNATTIRKASTKSLSPRKIDDTSGFYFLQTTFVNTNLNFLGVQFDVRSTCP
jgi:hypothetical protein